jgi:alpha-ketoglutarate-dependent taurine dioxygenase
MQIEPLSEHAGTAVSPSGDEDVLSLDINEIIELYRATGAVYFKDFTVGIGPFEQFTNQFSNDYMDNRGSGSYRDAAKPGADKTIQNVAYIYGVGEQRTFKLPLHADRSYVKSTPEMMWFMCAVPAKTGGQTTVCDGVAIYNAFSESTRKMFDSKRLKYIRHYDDGEWQVLFHSDDKQQVKDYCAANDLSWDFHDDNSLTTEFVKSAVVTPKYTSEKAFVNSIMIQLWQEDELGRKSSLVRLEDGSRIPDEVMDEVWEVSEKLTMNLPWRTGDFIMVDNTRMMHGRREFTGNEREIYVRMCRSVDW